MSKFELGDSVVLMKGSCLLYRRLPSFEGIVTARGDDCIRVKWFTRGFFHLEKNEWFSTINENYHFTKTESY